MDESVVDPIQSINRSAYLDKDTASHYARAEGLIPAEAVLFARLKEEILGGAILDLGVGGGRTTKALLEISSRYTGLDLSSAMISECRRRHPGVRFVEGNAAQLSQFHDGEWDLVVFAFNGIDSVGHETRMEILKEVCRVLKKGGYFAFSSHNREFVRYDSFPWPIPPWSWNPMQAMRNGRLFCARMWRHWRLTRLEIKTPAYSVINEPDHDYAILTYYVTLSEQRRQLTEAGFGGNLEVYNPRGQQVPESRTDRFLYFSVKK